MRVLWCSLTPGLLDEKKYGTWIAAMQEAMMKYSSEIELGIVFESEDFRENCILDGVYYFPMNKSTSKYERLIEKIDDRIHWKRICPQMIDIIELFKPDIIECFGTEWEYGLIKEKTDVPVVIHMQGFRNYINQTEKKVVSNYDVLKYYKFNPLKFFHYIYRTSKNKYRNETELKILAMNNNFVGRTNWDRSIVNYFSPSSSYYACEEVIRNDIYNSNSLWKYSEHQKMRLISISCASNIKGNGVILETAKMLQDKGIEFEWRVTGDKDTFSLFESKLGIKHEDVGIHLLGFINTEQIIDELCNNDIYVHCSIIDNSPNSICEAQLIGTPVVSTYVGGIEHLIENGVTGMFYPYNEPFSLAFLLLKIYKNKALLQRLSQNAYKVSHERHDPVKIVNKMQDIYQTIIEGENQFNGDTYE